HGDAAAAVRRSRGGGGNRTSRPPGQPRPVVHLQGPDLHAGPAWPPRGSRLVAQGTRGAGAELLGSGGNPALSDDPAEGPAALCRRASAGGVSRTCAALAAVPLLGA